MTLAVRGLRFAYAGRPPLLAGIDLVVEPGASVFLLGASGSGKSTILRAVAGLEPRYEGSVSLDGEAVDDLPPHRRRIGMLFQEPALFPHLNAWRNVAFGVRYSPQRPEDERAEALRWLELVGLAARAEAGVDELSGGERQRVALARALAAKPRAILLDEPLSALDRERRDDLGARIRRILAEARVPALWVTHDRDEAARLGDHAWLLRDGRLAPRVP